MRLSTIARLSALACGIGITIPAAPQNAGVQLEATPEYLRPDPFGGIVAPDRTSGAGFVRALSVEGARGGYVSFHLVVKRNTPGAYTLTLRFEGDAGKLKVDLFRE